MTEDGSKFFTNEGYKLASSSGKTVYIKGGEDQSTLEPVSVPKYGYTWTQTATYEYIHKTGNWGRLDDAYRYCVNHKGCVGITKMVSSTLSFVLLKLCTWYNEIIQTHIILTNCNNCHKDDK